MTTGIDRLSAAQRASLTTHLGAWSVVRDHSWGLTDMAVLEVESDRGHVVVKAAGPQNSHVGREIRAHEEWLAPWRDAGCVATLLVADREANLLVTTWLPGVSLEGTPAQDDPETFRQAGALLARLHEQSSRLDEGWNDQLRRKVEHYLARPHRIPTDLVELVRAETATWPDTPEVVVPTHGDYAPRNWLDDGGVVRVIDLGRADLRPREEDFVRVAWLDFVRDPRLEEAFVDGYGGDPRDPGLWRRMGVATAVSTAGWAYEHHDEPFEQLGLSRLAALYSPPPNNV